MENRRQSPLQKYSGALAVRRYVLINKARELGQQPEFNAAMSFTPHGVFKAMEPADPTAKQFIDALGQVCDSKPLRGDEIGPILIGAFGHETEVSHMLIAEDEIRLVPRPEWVGHKASHAVNSAT